MFWIMLLADYKCSCLLWSVSSAQSVVHLCHSCRILSCCQIRFSQSSSPWLLWRSFWPLQCLASHTSGGFSLRKPTGANMLKVSLHMETYLTAPHSGDQGPFTIWKYLQRRFLLRFFFFLSQIRKWWSLKKSAAVPVQVRLFIGK